MELGNLLEELKSTSKPTGKLGVLKKYDNSFLRYLIEATYDPFKIFHVSIKKSDVPSPGSRDLNDEKEELISVISFCENSNSNQQNREAVVKLLSKLNKGSQELVVGVLNKNWKVGLGVRNILKVFPNIIPRFEVQLANTYDRNKKYNFKRWVWSYKLDGLRCIALRESSDQHYDKGKWTLYSRKGKEFLTVEHLKEQLESIYTTTGWTFFDGELYKHGLAFEEIQGQVMGFKRGQAENIEYHVFVVGQAKDFLAGTNKESMIPIGGDSHPNAPFIKFINQGWCLPEEVDNRLEEAFDAGYEGIMLRDPDNPYDYKRSDALLKLKQGLDSDSGEIISDCVVVDVECDDFPVIEDEKLHHEELIVRLVVQQPNGIKCEVGSGFSLDFRRYYTNNKEELLGNVVEIKHQQWGNNGRMRFPRLFRVRKDL